MDPSTKLANGVDSKMPTKKRKRATKRLPSNRAKRPRKLSQSNPERNNKSGRPSTPSMSDGSTPRRGSKTPKQEAIQDKAKRMVDQLEPMFHAALNTDMKKMLACLTFFKCLAHGIIIIIIIIIFLFFEYPFCVLVYKVQI